MKGCTRGYKTTENGSNAAWGVRQGSQEDVWAEINLKGQTGRLISHPWERKQKSFFNYAQFGFIHPAAFPPFAGIIESQQCFGLLSAHGEQ